MKYNKEITIGAAVVVCVIIFIFGTRYFQALPFFSGSNVYSTTFADGGGLVSGNAVRINGVDVGSVSRVSLNDGLAQIDFTVNTDVILTHGSVTSISGFTFLGVTRMNLELGPPDATPYKPGDFIPSETNDELNTLLASVPDFLGHTDSLILGTTDAMHAARGLMEDPGSDLRQTLATLQSTADEIILFLRDQRAHLSAALANVGALAASANTLTQDSLMVTAGRLNTALAQLNYTLASFETTSSSLQTLLDNINDGKGTLGKLATDDSLYVELRAAATTINALLSDFQANPRKYLKDLKIVDIF